MSRNDVHETRSLRCRLTDSEWADRSNEMATLVREHDLLQEEKKEVTKDFKERIDKAEKRIRELAEIVRSRCEDREVSCRELRVLDEVRIVRADTRETVASRPLSREEKQQRIAFGDHGDDEAGDGDLGDRSAH